MPTNYTDSIRTALPGDGEQSGVWGQTVNVNYQLLEDAICGYVQVSVTSSNVTLTVADGATDQSRNMVLDLVGASTGARNVVVPAVEKLYLVFNSTTGGFTHTIKTPSGTGVTVAPGERKWVVCDATNVVNGTSASGSFLSTTGGTMTGAILFPDGTAGAPSISFASDTNTGLHRNSADSFSAVTNGAQVVNFASTEVNVIPAFAAQGNASIGGSLIVTGATLLNGNVEVGNAAGDVINVNGGTSFGSTVAIAGTFTANGNAGFNGAIAFGTLSQVYRISAGSFISHASSSNSSGVITVSTSGPTGGNNGDIWFQV